LIPTRVATRSLMSTACAPTLRIASSSEMSSRSRGETRVEDFDIDLLSCLEWGDEDSAKLVQPPSISTVKILSHAAGGAVNHARFCVSASLDVSVEHADTELARVLAAEPGDG